MWLRSAVTSHHPHGVVLRPTQGAAVGKDYSRITAPRQRNDSNQTGTPTAVTSWSQSDHRGPVTSRAGPPMLTAAVGLPNPFTPPWELASRTPFLRSPVRLGPWLRTVWTEARLSLEDSHRSDDFSPTLFSGVCLNMKLYYSFIYLKAFIIYSALGTIVNKTKSLLLCRLACLPNRCQTPS